MVSTWMQGCEECIKPQVDRLFVFHEAVTMSAIQTCRLPLKNNMKVPHALKGGHLYRFVTEAAGNVRRCVGISASCFLYAYVVKCKSAPSFRIVVLIAITYMGEFYGEVLHGGIIQPTAHQQLTDFYKH